MLGRIMKRGRKRGRNAPLTARVIKSPLRGARRERLPRSSSAPRLSTRLSRRFEMSSSPKWEKTELRDYGTRVSRAVYARGYEPPLRMTSFVAAATPRCNGRCEQRYKRRFTVVVVVGCSPFSLQMVSSADTCLFMSPSVPAHTVDATSAERGALTAPKVRGTRQLYYPRIASPVFLGYTRCLLLG